MNPAAIPQRTFAKRGATSTGNSACYWRKPTLGDKLQRLALVSPKHIQALDLLVDQLLRELLNKPLLVPLVYLSVTFWYGI